jgi:Tfp pilus assembly PilM family ATPase
MARIRTGIDIGTDSSRALRGQWKGNTFVATDYAYAQHPGASGWSAAWAALRAELEPQGFKPLAARVGITGRDVNVRYTRVPRVPDWQLAKLMRFEVEEVGGQSGAEVASDYNVLPELPELESEDVVLLAMARESLLAEHLEGLVDAGGKLDAFTPNSIALYNAWLRFGVVQDDTVLLANVEHESIDVVLVRGADLLFARNLAGGTKSFERAVQERLGVDAKRAAALLAKDADFEPGARPRSPDGEKATRACLGAAGQLSSLLQSAVLFCKSQIKVGTLKLDRVMLCGSGARLAGLDKYLTGALSVKVERFDPFRVVDTSALSPEELEALEAHALESVVALGLATAASDPNCYAVEILPAAVARAREFREGTAWLIAAGALCALGLCAHAWRTRAELRRVRAEVTQLDAKHKSARSADAKTRALLAESEALAASAEELGTLAGAGAQLARTLDGVGSQLPSDFWLTRLSSAQRFDPQLGVPKGDPRPVVHAEGAAREGTAAANVLFQDFVARLQKSLPAAKLKPMLAPTGQSFALDLTELAPAPPASAGAAGAAGEGG